MKEKKQRTRNQLKDKNIISTHTYLEQAYFIPFEIQTKAAHINNLEAISESDKDFAAAEIFNLYREIDELKKLYYEIKERIHSFSSNKLYIIVLEMRYLSGLKIKEIAEQINYCEDHISRVISRRALIEFKAKYGL